MEGKIAPHITAVSFRVPAANEDAGAEADFFGLAMLSMAPKKTAEAEMRPMLGLDGLSMAKTWTILRNYLLHSVM